MKLKLEATVAGKSQVLADGLVRVNVSGESGATVGKLSLAEPLWQWLRDWVKATAEMGLVEIEVVEIEHRPEDMAKPGTMRGRLLEAAATAASNNASRIPQDGTGGIQGSTKSQKPQPGAIAGQIHGLYREVQRGKKR